jgi:hypothetical protein
VEEDWASSLQYSAQKLEDLAKFYHCHGFFIVATLLSAATEAIQDEAAKINAKGWGGKPDV